MKTYITSYGIVSPQNTFDQTGFPAEVINIKTNRMSCVEPVYRDLINPLQLRRMPRILKIALAAAIRCLNNAGELQPDGIIVGTGLGCLDNLEKFMLEMIEKEEHITSVLPFINSTHNAVASQIAMMLNNYSYNYTYCHRAFSFESALKDAILHLSENPVANILAGGVDECTDNFMHIHDYLAYWKDPASNLRLFHHRGPGTIAGEGAAFFLLSGQRPTNASAVLRGIQTLFFPAEDSSETQVTKALKDFLDVHGLSKDDIDVAILGMNGDHSSDKIYRRLQSDFFGKQTHIAAYKHLCGEYYTASAFALWLGTVILKGQQVPDPVMIEKRNASGCRHLLIYNHYNMEEHAMLLLSLDNAYADE